MNSVREYRIPILIGVGTLVVALLLWAVLISSQSSKVSKLQSQETQLQGQQSQLEAKLADLKSERQRVPGSCADLQKIVTQIPSVQSPTDVDAEESSFESQFNSLAASTGVALTQFSGFSGGSAATTTATATPPTGAAASPLTKAGVVAVPTTLTVSGVYNQIMNFVNGLDGFPRLFVIQNFNLALASSSTSSSGSSAGAGAGAGATSSSSATGQAATVDPTAAPLWTAGTGHPPGNSPYNLTIDGSIYYSTTPSAIDTCVKATEAIKKG